MSVLIKMEMPEKCGKCRFATAFECQVTKNFITTFNVRQVDCPLVPVPRHGRLIDADAFENFIRKDWDKNDHWIADVVYSRPTIIPASEEAKE